jgi:Transposase domain (DUF772)
VRIDWKYLLGLPLEDPGFDHTVLAEFRGKVAGAGLEQVALDALLAKLAAYGLIKAGGKAANRLHARGRRGGGAEPAGAGRGERAGRAGGPELHRNGVRTRAEEVLPDGISSAVAPGAGDVDLVRVGLADSPQVRGELLKVVRAVLEVLIHQVQQRVSLRVRR